MMSVQSTLVLTRVCPVQIASIVKMAREKLKLNFVEVACSRCAILYQGRRYRFDYRYVFWSAVSLASCILPSLSRLVYTVVFILALRFPGHQIS